MKYIVYKITNLVNGKIYVGVHKTININDNYMGSGKLIRRSIKKHGIENFKKEYLHVFDNPDDMYNMESLIVNNDFLLSDNVYNIVNGGHGSFDYINQHILTPEMRSKFGRWSNTEKRRKIREHITIEKQIEMGRYMGTNFGGSNKLSDDEIKNRLDKIKEVDLMKYGWVKKVSDILEITHTQTKRFIKKYYNGSYYKRN